MGCARVLAYTGNWAARHRLGRRPLIKYELSMLAGRQQSNEVPAVSHTLTARDLALRALIAGMAGIAMAYVSAFLPLWLARLGPWLMAIVMPLTMCAMMILGAVRAGRGIGPLAGPFALVFLLIAGGFVLALALPTENANTPLWFGLPPRAAVLLCGVGLVPLLLLPVVYALTFDLFILTDEDLARVRAARLPDTKPTGARARSV